MAEITKVKTPYITPPRSEDEIERWRQRASELLNQISDGIDVSIQDQTSPSVIIPANQVIVTSTLASSVTIDSKTCTVVSAAGMTEGDMAVFTSTVGNRYFWAYITVISGNNITINNYFDYAFESGQEMSACEKNLAVDGSVTRQIFSLRAAEPAAGIALEVDVTRIVFQCRTGTAPQLSDFGDIADGIANGLLCRKVDGTYEHVFTVRSNDEIQGIAYDYDVTTAAGAGQDGFSARLTFAGQDKIGVVKRIGKDEDLQFIVSDNLAAITNLQIMIMGHIVVD